MPTAIFEPVGVTAIFEPVDETPAVKPPLDITAKAKDIVNRPAQLLPFVSSAADIYKYGKLGMAAYRLKNNQAQPEDEALLQDYLENEGIRRLDIRCWTYYRKHHHLLAKWQLQEDSIPLAG